jgi:hypothetical protein
MMTSLRLQERGRLHEHSPSEILSIRHQLNNFGNLPPDLASHVVLGVYTDGTVMQF